MIHTLLALVAFLSTLSAVDACMRANFTHKKQWIDALAKQGRLDIDTAIG